MGCKRLSEDILLRGLANSVLGEIFVANREEVVRKPKSTQICIDDDDDNDDDKGRRIRRMKKVTHCGVGWFALSHSVIRVKKSRRV